MKKRKNMGRRIIALALATTGFVTSLTSCKDDTKTINLTPAKSIIQVSDKDIDKLIGEGDFYYTALEDYKDNSCDENRVNLVTKGKPLETLVEKALADKLDKKRVDIGQVIDSTSDGPTNFVDLYDDYSHQRITSMDKNMKSIVSDIISLSSWNGDGSNKEAWDENTTKEFIYDANDAYYSLAMIADSNISIDDNKLKVELSDNGKTLEKLKTK